MKNQSKDKLKSILIAPSEPFLGNRLFNADDKILNRDDTLRPNIELKKFLKNKGYDLNTIDMGNIDKAEWLIFFDSHKDKDYFKYCLSKKLNYKMILILWEPPVTSKVAVDNKYHSLFKYVLTWNDELVDNKKYYKFFLPYPFSKDRVNTVSFMKRKLLVLIAGNKISIHPDELYSERIRAINYFTLKAPREFEFYGMGWQFPVSMNPIRLLKNTFKYLKRPNMSSYGGTIDDKIETLSKYKFCVCYENTKNIKGYISEKIFDCFKASCVPIYWGASNINDYIPLGCFIDKRSLSYDDLFEFLLSIDEEMFIHYLNNIKSFLSGDIYKRFSINNYVNTIDSLLFGMKNKLI